ncbi:MlaC/ttg2D family ABC transporter substrate-binding protein [Kozakia baliensis]|uniref:MlaC/ttg2D family ABC transporter substrate-binding protein n=1 Tax=Kozakia baliensis TaxID=153496 RepID=UPI000497B7A1|nr:ABC transporter substrate-binding protein [Kozakia baliensis]
MLKIFPTMSRRGFGLLAAAVFSLSVGVVGTARADQASDFVKNFGGKLVNLINSDKSSEEKKKEALPLLQQNVDIPTIGKFCLGRYWRTASPDQQQRYLELFHHVLVNAVTDKLGDYRGVTFRVTGTASSPNGELVSAQIDRPGQPTTDIQLLISKDNGPKVVDMIGEGASLRLTQRQDYGSYLARNGGNVETLNNALQRQLANRH